MIELITIKAVSFHCNIDLLLEISFTRIDMQIEEQLKILTDTSIYTVFLHAKDIIVECSTRVYIWLHDYTSYSI
jgi:hypothetical protein